MRISFKQQVVFSPKKKKKKNEPRARLENVGSPLQYYLKEVDDQKLVHNPQNIIQVDKEGILRIQIA